MTYISRRKFLGKSALAASLAPLAASSLTSPFVRSVRAAEPGPNDKVRLGLIGCGGMGQGDLECFFLSPEVDCVVVCDVDDARIAKGVEICDSKRGKKPETVKDFRRVLDRKDVDVVLIATPDHWHALPMVLACQAGKDVYVEKPLAKTIDEGRAMLEAAKRHQRVVQMGSQWRSCKHIMEAGEFIRSGKLGKVSIVRGWAYLDWLPSIGKPADCPPPPGVDYEMWLGPSRKEPYIQARVHMDWRWNYNTGGGQLLDWIGHHCDIAHWGMDMDTGGPSEIEGKGEFPPADAIWNTCTKYRIELKYPKDITMIIAGGHDDIRSGTKWIGTDGWVWVDRGGFDATNTDWFQQIPADKYTVKLYKSDNHQRNFIECVKSRKPTITPIEVAHHSAIPGHLGLISMLVGRKIKWDVAKEVIVGDAEASKLLTRPYRNPWKMV